MRVSDGTVNGIDHRSPRARASKSKLGKGNSAARVEAVQAEFRRYVESGEAFYPGGWLKASREIGREIGVSLTTVQRWMRTFYPDHHATMRARRPHPGTARIREAKEKFDAFVTATGCRKDGRLLTSAEIGEMFGVSDNSILYWLRTRAPDIHAEMAARNPRRRRMKMKMDRAA